MAPFDANANDIVEALWQIEQLLREIRDQLKTRPEPTRTGTAVYPPEVN